MATSDKEVKDWFTANHKHIPIFEGESKQDAYNRSVKENEKEDKRERDIAKAKEEADKLNSESKYQDSLKAGNKVEIKDGHMVFKGKEIPDADLADADGSLADNIVDGKLTAKRRELHAKIIQDYFEGHKPYAPGEQKLALFTGGGGASGKGQFSDPFTDGISKFYSKNDDPLVVDPDEIKKVLASADGHDKLNPELTSYYHEESSALAKRIYETAIANNFPVMFDGTATSVPSALKKIEQARKAGYKTEMCFMFSDPKTVIGNALYRYKTQDRLVPLDSMCWAHMNAYDAVQSLQDQYDSFKLYDNAGRQLKLVGESSLGKKMTVHNKESYDRFSNSAEDFNLSPKTLADFYAEVDKISAEKRKKKGGK